MKVLCIDDSRYLYPASAQNLDSFIQKHPSGFVKLTQLVDEYCVHPYYIDEDIRAVYINMATVCTILEEEVVLMPRDEYEKRALALSETICRHCTEYQQDFINENSTESYRNKLCLNGTCEFYSED